MQLFYNSDIKQGATTFFFDKEESKHIVKVLRKKESDKIFITNGLGCLFESEIILASEKKCEVKITKEINATLTIPIMAKTRAIISRGKLRLNNATAAPHHDNTKTHNNNEPSCPPHTAEIL